MRVVRGEADIAVTLGVAASQATEAKGIAKEIAGKMEKTAGDVASGLAKEK